MSTQKKSHNKKVFHGRIVLRLWLSMMALVVISILFMWVTQIYLFSRNYARLSLGDAERRLTPVMESMAGTDLAADEWALPRLSRIFNGELILTDPDGNLLQMYSSGHRVNLEKQREERALWNQIVQMEEFQNFLKGEPYRVVDRHGGRIAGFGLGFTATYDGQPCFVILHNTIMLKTAMDLNRRQLILTSILMTGIASLLALILSRQFTRPIFQIRDAVERLTHSDFSARPQVKRDDELGQLSHSVEELGTALQRVDVLRKEVIANVSHELRSPLAVIGGYAEMVRDITWRNEAQRNEDLDLIIHESRRMSEMVSDILDYSQLQAGYIQLKKDWYSLTEILESEVTHCRPSAAEHQIRLELSCPDQELQVQVDALKMSQVIRNLLYNAINHTKDRESIRVEARTRQGVIHVSVSNPGPSIPEDERELIWERYQRSQHESGRRLGTGIGLSIVSTILKAHDMNYGVDCQDGWTSFWFECPFVI